MILVTYIEGNILAPVIWRVFFIFQQLQPQQQQQSPTNSEYSLDLWNFQQQDHNND